MKRTYIWFLLTLMGFTVLALIVLQALWIRNSVQVKEQHFNQLVRSSLALVASDIERQEARAKIVSELNPKYLQQLRNSYAFDTVIIENGTWLEFRQNLNLSDNPLEAQFETNISLYKDDSLASEPTELHENQADTISDSLQSHAYLDFSHKLNRRRLLVDNIVDKLVRFNPKIEERVDPESLEKQITTVLSEKGINLAFEYAVTRWETEPVFQSAGFVTEQEIDYYRVKLFPDDFNSEHNYLYLFFPEKPHVVLFSLGLKSISSMVLALLLICSFSLVTYVILRQKKLSEIRNDFVSNMTHELKTPISTISLASQMLGDKTIPTEAKNIDYLAGIITVESKRLGRHVEKVLQLAVFEKGKLDLKVSLIDLEELLTGVVNNFTIQIKHKNGRITTRFNAAEHRIIGDEVHLTNVFNNVVDNAIKYCAKEPEIDLETYSNSNYFIVKVMDNGIGISKSDQNKIFEKFYRVSTGNLHDVKGFGLGLSYVRKIVEEHKGYIRLESELHVGTTFKIYLPLNNNNS